MLATTLTPRYFCDSLENIADELHDLGAPEAGHVDVVPVQLARSSAPRRGSASGRVRQSNRAASAVAGFLYTVLRSTLASTFCALRRSWAASRCLVAVSITRRMARRCWVMPIPRLAKWDCSRPVRRPSPARYRSTISAPWSARAGTARLKRSNPFLPFPKYPAVRAPKADWTLTRS